nr:MAG TPA: NADPH-dependent 7-cyano-7-deazaguanine reductase [Caudoviricetes sp.]
MAKKPKKEVILDDFRPEADVDTIDDVELQEEPVNLLYQLAQASIAIKPTEPQPIELLPMPRYKSSLKLKGFDVHYHRISYLLDSGAPVAGWVTIAIPSDSEEILEKDSVARYLDSYTMARMGRAKDEANQLFIRQVKEDIDKLLRVDSIVKLFDEPQKFFDSSKFYSLDSIPFPHDDFKLQSGRTGFDEHGEALICFHAFRAKQNASVYIGARDKLETISLYESLVSWRQNESWHEVVADLLMEELSFSKSAIVIDFGSFIALRWNLVPFAFQKPLID